MSNIRIAYQTLRLMDECVRRDNGTQFRAWEQRVLPHMSDAYAPDTDGGRRGHLGASIVGQECPRSIWYDFRWATVGKFNGRMLRLFNRGHLEEGRLIALFLTMGCQVYQQDHEGRQFRISWADNHAGGSSDGKINSCPDIPIGHWCLLEFKTHSEKSFKELAGDPKEWRKHLEDPQKYKFTGKGVQIAKPEHYVQTNIYMRKFGIPITLYVGVNKDTDDIYAELIVLNSEIADRYLARGEKLVYLDKPPSKINPSAGFWKCQWCDHKPVCHLNQKPDRNCRTCEFSQPLPGGKDRGRWVCTKRDIELSKEMQLSGCDQYAVKRDF